MNDFAKIAREDELPRPFNVNLSTVGRFAAGGALTGVSLATTLALLRMMKELSDKRKAMEEGPANTIILTIPKKAEDGGGEPADYPSVEGPDDTVDVGDGPVTNTGIPGLHRHEAPPASVPAPATKPVTTTMTIPVKEPAKGDKTTKIDNSNTPEEAAKVKEPENTDMGTGEIGTEHKDEKTQPSKNYKKVPANTDWFSDLTSMLALKVANVKRAYKDADSQGSTSTVDSHPDFSSPKKPKVTGPESVSVRYGADDKTLKNKTETGQFVNPYAKISSVKQANWQTFAAAMLAAGGGGTAGYALVNRIFARKREKELEKELLGAKQEYLDMLSKNGAALEKTAADRHEGSRTFGFLDYPIGMAALLYMLGAGGTAWLTKRILDHYSTQGATPDENAAPDIKRIMFSTEKTASDDSEARDVMEAAVGVYLDLCSGRADIIGDMACKQAMLIEPSELYKMASEDYDKLVMYLKSNPQLRSTIKRLAMEKHPLLKHLKMMANWPLIGGMGDKKLFDELRRRFGPESEIFDKVRAEAAAKTAGALTQEEADYQRYKREADKRDPMELILPGELGIASTSAINSSPLADPITKNSPEYIQARKAFQERKAKRMREERARKAPQPATSRTTTPQPTAMPPKTSAAADDKKKGSKATELLRDIRLLKEYLLTLGRPSESKKAGVKEAAGLGSVLVGGSLMAPLADTAFEATMGSGKKKNTGAAAPIPLNKEERVQAILQDIELRSTDRNAALFLAQNRSKIENAVRVLVEQGLIR